MFLVNISPRGIGGFSEEGMEGQLGFSIICGFSGNNSSSNRCNACIQRMPAEPFKSNSQLALDKLSASLVMNRCAQGFNSQRYSLAPIQKRASQALNSVLVDWVGNPTSSYKTRMDSWKVDRII